MKAILLGNSPSLLVYLISQGVNVFPTKANTEISLSYVKSLEPDFIISHGYRHIISKEIINYMGPRGIINLHISYLPWNRGADPNFWSFVEDTAKGVTLHYVDEGVDTGPIIAQGKSLFGGTHTLRSTYEYLQALVVDLFIEKWPAIRDGVVEPKLQSGAGSFHRSSDKKRLSFLTEKLGFDTPVTELEDYAAEMQASKQYWEGEP